MMKTKIGVFILVMVTVFIIAASWFYNSRMDFVEFGAAGGGFCAGVPPREFVEYVYQVLRTNGFTVLSTTDTGSYIRSAESNEDISVEDISVSFRDHRIYGELKIVWYAWDYGSYWLDFHIKVKNQDHAIARAVITTLSDQLRHLPD